MTVDDKARKDILAQADAMWAEAMRLADQAFRLQASALTQHGVAHPPSGEVPEPRTIPRSPEILADLRERQQRRERAEQKVSSLTLREREVLRLVAEGYSNREISRRLGITERTTKNHLHSAFAKLEVSDRMQATLVMGDAGELPRRPALGAIS